MWDPGREKILPHHRRKQDLDKKEREGVINRSKNRNDISAHRFKQMRLLCGLAVRILRSKLRRGCALRNKQSESGWEIGKYCEPRVFNIY